MSPRKRLSPSSSRPRLFYRKGQDTGHQDNDGDDEGPPILPLLLPHRREMEEYRMVRMLSWITVALTMGAIAVIVFVEQRAHGPATNLLRHTATRSLTEIGTMDKGLLRLDSGDKDASSAQPPRMNLLFQTKWKEAPVCEPSMAKEDVAFTMVTQCSDSRLWMMRHHCQRWSGPISLVVYTNHTLRAIHEFLFDGAGCDPQRLHVQTYPADTMVDYPINFLRNLAFSAVKTSHAFYVDVDFWPSSRLHEALGFHRDVLARDDRQALVVPAFMLTRQCKEWRDCSQDNIPKMPTTQIDLYDGLVAKRIFPFDPTNRGGHGSTMYSEWLEQPADQLLPISCFQSNRYEPYLVVRYCRDLPPFQEGFTGYGKNKVSWVMQLRRAGWTFDQVGEEFVVHYPHLDSPARQAWNGDADHPRITMMQKPNNEDQLLKTKRGFNDRVFVEFRDWLDHEYPLDDNYNLDSQQGIRTPICQGATDDNMKLWVPHTESSPNTHEQF